MVKRLRHRPFTAVTWVRFPYGSPYPCGQSRLCREDRTGHQFQNTGLYISFLPRVAEPSSIRIAEGGTNRFFLLPCADYPICAGRLLRPVGQVVKTTASHAVNGSSTLPRVTINKHQLRNNNLSFFPIFVPLDGKEPHADVVELADAADSKSVGSNTMRVQVPPSAPMRCITENGRASGTTI